MRILVASVSNAPEDVLRPHVESVLAQDLPPRTVIDLAYISDGLSSEAEKVLVDAGARISEALPKTPETTYAVSEETHHWSPPTFAWLAYEKQRLLALAKDERYDGVFFVDSDLVLGPETLASLIYAQKDVTSAVFWTRWTPKAPLLPQVWMRHPYEFDGRGLAADEFLRELEEKALIRVGGLGACTLIRARVFEKVEWFPLLEGLPEGGMWQGEDRSFCIKAERAHVELWADAWPDVFHLYRPSERKEFEEWSPPKRVQTPSVGSWVSLVLEPIEEPALTRHREHLRGRLGALPVLPEIERTILGMRVGDARVVKMTFPPSYVIPEYRNREKSVLVRLLDAKDV